MVAYRRMSERILVTGLGVVSSLGLGHAPFAEAIQAGRCGIRPITAFDTAGCRSHSAGKLQGFDAARFIQPAKLRRIDEVGRLAIASARLAMEDAGIDPAGGGSDDIGVVLGSFTAGVHSTVEYLNGLMKEGPAGTVPLIFSNTVPNAPASLCALEFGLRGPNCTVSHKEASALGAVAFAVSMLRTGRAQAILSGGADDIEANFFRVHDRFRVLSPRNGGQEVSRPFDRRRNGFVFGEGGFVLLLEREASARARGARAYGEILGIGATASPCRLNDWPEDEVQLRRAMRLAIEEGGSSPGDVDLVLASANSTLELDRLEAAALADVFGQRRVEVSSIKGALGEFGASGAASLIAGLLARGHSPPTVGFQEPDPECPVNVSATARPAPGASLFLVNSFASGGANYSLLARSLS